MYIFTYDIQKIDNNIKISEYNVNIHLKPSVIATMNLILIRSSELLRTRTQSVPPEHERHGPGI